jgi:2-oxoglutarate ferredoxin oxidoreductase subunit alpha
MGDKKLSSMVILGAFCKLFNLEKKISCQNLSGDQIAAFEYGYNICEKHFIGIGNTSDTSLLLNGNQATALGAIAAGMDFYSTYPMTPATSIMTYLADNQKEMGYIVEQAEDEIAAINMATGASYAGARSFVATSGGGFALMTEGLGMSAIAELPIVILNVQRPGPATGMPTKTSQSDLSFVLHASPDEYPSMVIALTSVEKAFYQTFRAFNLADKYQMPIILLSDRYLADSMVTISPFNLSSLRIDRALSDGSDPSYKRHKLTDSGISPRILPGNTYHTIMADSHEHDEEANIIEDTDMRILMHDKRLRKLATLSAEVEEPEFFGSNDAETIVIGWGSARGLLKELINDPELIENNIGALAFGDIWPLPQKTLGALQKRKVRFICVEHNATGQFSKYLRSETGLQVSHNILKYDGRQFDVKELKSKILEVL